MSGSPGNSWSSDPNAPQIPYELYLIEKVYFAGNIIGTILYGIVVAQFFQCMSALLNHARRDIKWGLVIHTVLMFSCATLFNASLYLESISYVDDRGFPGAKGIPPGPVGYQYLIGTDSLTTLCYLIVYLNQWLADGLLLYRYCIIFAMNYWFIALPCLAYLASVAMGITLIYESLRPDPLTYASVHPIALSFYGISVSLNIILTLMIVARLVLHKRNIQNAMGTAHKPAGLYNVVATMLVESCALYAVTYLVYIVLWGTNNPAELMFYQLLIVSQVIGPFLIVERVANRTALTRDDISGNVGSIRFKSRGGSTANGTSSVDEGGDSPGELGFGVESFRTIDEVAGVR